MSVHLMQCAAEVSGIPPSHKLLLLCLADDSRDDARTASPGLEKAMQWSGLSRSRAFEALAALVELRLVASLARGQKYRRATYVVFPDGCCAAHGRRVSESEQSDAEPGSGSDTQDAERPVDSPTTRTLIAAQGPTFGSQGPTSGLSGSDRPDPSRKDLLEIPPRCSPLDVTPPAREAVA